MTKVEALVSPIGADVEETVLEELRQLVGEERNASRAETQLHRAADAHVAQLSVAFRYAFAMARKALRGKNVESAVKALRKALGDVLPAALRKVMVAGGEAGVAMLTAKRGLRAAADKPLKFRFDAKNKHVIDWADKHAAELIDNISETTREQINNAIAEALEEGNFEEARDEILAAVGDEDRADLIARHETMLAASAGQREAWDQAVEEGLLTGREQRTWIVVGDEKVCPICEELDGKTADLDGEYPGGYEGPPAHVACRCTEGIIA